MLGGIGGAKPPPKHTLFLPDAVASAAPKRLGVFEGGVEVLGVGTGVPRRLELVEDLEHQGPAALELPGEMPRDQLAQATLGRAGSLEATAQNAPGTPRAGLPSSRGNPL